MPERFLTEIRRRRFGFIFQQFNLIPGLTALDNVMLPAYPRDDAPELRRAPRNCWPVSSSANGATAKMAVRRRTAAGCHLPRADQRSRSADRRRADRQSRLPPGQEFMGILEALIASGNTVLLSSHDPLVVESTLVQRVIGMRDGKVVAHG